LLVSFKRGTRLDRDISMTPSGPELAMQSDSRARWPAGYALELLVIGAVYFALAKGGLLLASIHPSATPIWPPTGFALAVVLLRGYRIWPAIFAGAFIANATTAGTLVTAASIGIGNTLEGVIGGLLISRWSNGRHTFATPAGVARFALISFLPTAISASVGVGTLVLAGFAQPANFAAIWLTWWLGDLAGALVVTPAIVLWAQAGQSPSPAWAGELDSTAAQDTDDRPALGPSAWINSAAVIAGACAVGVIAFSPLIEQSGDRSPLGFLAILPLLWAGLRGAPRDTAAVALVLSAFAVWGTLAGSGPFARDNLNDSFLILLMFMITTAVPSLALSADVAVRKATEAQLRLAQAELAERVNARTAALTSANLALHAEDQHRKLIESELDEKRLYLLEAQRLANLGNWVWHVDEDKVAWSDQLTDIYGLKPGGFDGTFEGYLRLVHPDDRERIREAITQAFQSRRGFRIDERIVRPNGDIKHLQSVGEVIKDDRGQVVRMLGVCQDVTERVQAEGALRESEEKLAQAHKMEAIGQLTGGIAHDFNNILMIVSGHAEMLRRRLSEPKARKGIDAIAAAARRGEGLTRQLLTFSRRQPLSPEVIGLKQRIEAVRDMLVGSLRGNIALAVDIPEDIWRVEVDVAEFELALVNIAVNARDAMPEGGSFTVTARNVRASDARKTKDSPGDHVELTLADTGTGIPPDVIAKIFDPFFTTKAIGKGTGLGLSQVYGFVSQSRGVVTAASEAGRGTTFTLCLPRSHARAAPAPSPVRAQKKPAQGEGTILVVEDNPEVGDIAVTLLEQLGYQVLRAENAADALLTLERSPEVDLVFSDIVMPNGMNGIHLAQEVSEQYPDVRVLLMTGYSEVAVAAEARFPILRKPFAMSELERAVRETLAMQGQQGPWRNARGSAQ
jgi:PAS domain S-box-containing protein